MLLGPDLDPASQHDRPAQEAVGGMAQNPLFQPLDGRFRGLVHANSFRGGALSLRAADGRTIGWTRMAGVGNLAKLGKGSTYERSVARYGCSVHPMLRVTVQ